MFPPRPEKPRLVYMKYKDLGNDIFAELDPDGRLDPLTRREAKEIVLHLVRELPEERHDLVKKKLTKAIELRKECATYHLDKPKRSQKFHNMYISFLAYIKIQLDLYKRDREASVTENECDPAVDEIEQQPQARSEGDDEPDENEEPNDDDDDDEEDLTLEQIDFLAFLRTLMALVEKAAALWTTAVQGELDIWVAANRK